MKAQDNSLSFKELAEKIVEGLKKHFPQPWSDLNFENPYQLLVATILAAQANDKKVNEVTKEFFKKYPTPEDVAKAPLEQIEQDIRQINFYRRKAKILKECCKVLVEKFGGKVPDNIEDLTKLPGVGRKTANVILVNAFKKPAVVVDTHVKRVSQRLNLTDKNDLDKIEQDLMRIFKKEDWAFISNALVLFGRYVCKAKKPLCHECHLYEICKSKDKIER